MENTKLSLKFLWLSLWRFLVWKLIWDLFPFLKKLFCRRRWVMMMLPETDIQLKWYSRFVCSGIQSQVLVKNAFSDTLWSYLTNCFVSPKITEVNECFLGSRSREAVYTYFWPWPRCKRYRPFLMPLRCVVKCVTNYWCNKIEFPNNFFVAVSLKNANKNFKPTIFWLALQGHIFLCFYAAASQINGFERKKKNFPYWQWLVNPNNASGR